MSRTAACVRVALLIREQGYNPYRGADGKFVSGPHQDHDSAGTPMPFTKAAVFAALAQGQRVTSENGAETIRAEIHGHPFLAKVGDTAAGHLQQRHEVATIAALHALGMGDLAPSVAYHLIAPDGTHISIQALESGKTADAYPITSLARMVHEPDLQRAALAEYLLGMQDRASDNLLVTPNGGIKEIDHGEGFAKTLEDFRDSTVVRAWQVRHGTTAPGDLAFTRSILESAQHRSRAVLQVLQHYHLPAAEQRSVMHRFEVLEELLFSSEGFGDEPERAITLDEFHERP